MLDAYNYKVVRDPSKQGFVRRGGRHPTLARSVEEYVWDGRGGADRDRTDDLRLAKPALSQLSYSPEERGEPSSSCGGPGQT
jgi:hypothetical protein